MDTKARLRIAAVAVALLALDQLRLMAEYPWEPPTNKIVIMAVNAHPDDEGIFFGGALTYYSAVGRLPTLLVSLTSGDWIPANLTVREEELRCAAWTYGLRYEPLFPRFRDVPSQSLNPNPYTNRIDATWDYWADGVLQGDGSDVQAGQLRAIHYLAEQIRRYRPEVIFTHDANGEYGHDNHRATAYAVTNAFFVAADPGATATNLTGLPPWQAKKLYLHSYPVNRLFHRFWEDVFPELTNRTPRQVADAGLDCHVSQGRPDVSTVYRSGENFDGHPSEWWGLYASTVGPDTVLNNSLIVKGYTVPAGVAAGNFLEHLRPLDATNAPPAFTANPLLMTRAFHGAVYTGQTLGDKVTDPDLVWGDTLAFQKMAGPAWLTVSPQGLLGGQLSSASLGTNTFTVRVADVAGLFAETTLLVVVDSGCPPWFTNITRLADGSTRMTIEAPPGQTYVVEAATNLRASVWWPLATNVSGTNKFQFVDPTNRARCFYRAVIP